MWRYSSACFGNLATVGTEPTPRGLRADAVRNRDCILQAARKTFAEHGTDVALEEIARLAGVGIATLYRRFPSRSDLVAAAFEPKMRAYAAAAQAAVAEEDPWEGFATFVRAVCAMQAADAGFADVLALTFPATPELDRQLRKATAGLERVIEAAQAAGALRTDFVVQDLVLLLMANAGVVNATKRYAPNAWERFAAYMLDAFRLSGHAPLPEPIKAARLSLAIRRRN
jgi:AcrR family transcriptional regulator